MTMIKLKYMKLLVKNGVQDGVQETTFYDGVQAVQGVQGVQGVLRENRVEHQK